MHDGFAAAGQATSLRISSVSVHSALLKRAFSPMPLTGRVRRRLSFSEIRWS